MKSPQALCHILTASTHARVSATAVLQYKSQVTAVEVTEAVPEALAAN